jgi:hypothetical protein
VERQGTVSGGPGEERSAPFPRGPGGAGRGAVGASGTATYRYWPVLEIVSMARPESAPLPVTSVRM